MTQFKKITPARKLALEILRRVETEKSYAGNLLASEITDRLSAADRRLTYELVLGVLRWQLQLDFIIEKLSGRAIRKLDLDVLIALRLGLYQLRFLTRIPPSAAVNESVELIKKSKYKSASSFVNALLRRAIRESDQILSALDLDNYDQLAIKLSHPKWLIEKWSNQFGADAAKELALANNQHPATAFRLNHLKFNPDETKAKMSERGIEIVPGQIAPGGYRIAKGPVCNLKEFADSGSIYFQDEASQLVASLVSAKTGERILDLCAAPGSKTTQIAADMNNTGLIIAGDLHLHRLKTLKRTCEILGVNNVRTTAFDAGKALPFGEGLQFDCVLIDTPCSGTGTLRHNPEIKWRIAPEQITELASLQSKMLENAFNKVRDGGRLVYSTCSLEQEEDENIVFSFLASHPEFEILRPNVMHTTREGFVRTFPHTDGTDGFFAAVLSRKIR